MKLFDSGHKEMKRCRKLAKKILALEPEIASLSDDDLKQKTEDFKTRYKNGESLNKLLIEAYAVCREAAFRVTGMKAFPVQLTGAALIHGGNIAEMRTGEGKTLTAVFPAYLNALTGEGVHIVTVNEYLAKREAEGEIGDIYRFLGLTVGLNLSSLSQIEKKEAYEADILYSTNSELGFDYLRDHMARTKEQLVQRGLNYAIIDEVDSILIDEARTPLIISGGSVDNSSEYIKSDSFVKRLKDEDYLLDLESRTIVLTDEGIAKAERYFKVPNIYDPACGKLLHHINNALRANFIFKHGVEYVVQEGVVNIVDSFTGRILKGRQYSDGLHQAIEAKENVKIQEETKTIANITYQNFFRLYKKLSGMTGTAKTEEEEFRDIYNMYVGVIPTNRPVIREDRKDLLFYDLESKFNYLVEEIKRIHETGQPILVGTADVETSELVSQKLRAVGLKHEILNAKNNEREAEIVKNAGQLNAITISTNMAGRGTDIKLGEGVKELGGLFVFGTERHESRRIDNQLRGRSGRQGDPGISQFLISLEDTAMIRFLPETKKQRIQSLIKSTDVDITKPLNIWPITPMFRKAIVSIQKRIEGNNYDSRKHVLRYDDVIRLQREVFYAERMTLLLSDDVIADAKPLFFDAINLSIKDCIKEDDRSYKIEDEEIVKVFNMRFLKNNPIEVQDIESLSERALVDFLFDRVKERMDAIASENPPQVYLDIAKSVMLQILDDSWTNHIDTMDNLRQSVSLQGYAQQNPLQIYKQEGFKEFNDMLDKAKKHILHYLTNIRIERVQE